MANSNGMRIISVLSGRGGVGKSIISLNLSERLANLGYRVLLVDADFCSGNLHVLANVHSEYGINEYVIGAVTLKEAVVSISGFDLLSSTWNEALAEERNIQETNRFITSLIHDARNYDYIIFDHSSGRSNQAVAIAQASDLNLLIVLPELTSLADGYGLFKNIIKSNHETECLLLVNRVLNPDDAEFIRIQMMNLTNQFLKTSPGFIGFIAEDQLIRRAVASQSPLSVIEPNSEITSRFSNLAQVVAREKVSNSVRIEGDTKSIINKTQATADIRG